MSVTNENCLANFDTGVCHGCEQLAYAVSADILDMSGIKGTKQKVLAETVRETVVSIAAGEFPVRAVLDSPENRGRRSCEDRRAYIAKNVIQLTRNHIIKPAEYTNPFDDD